MIRSLYDFLFALLAIVGAIVSLILFGHDYFGQFQDQARIAIVFLGIFALVFFVYSVSLHARWGRAVRYGLVLPYLNQGFSHVHNAVRAEPPSPPHLFEACRHLCGNLATAFSVLTGSPCAVSIELIKGSRNNGEERLSVVTMCRDDQSSGMRDYPDSAKSTEHWLDQNSDFASIFANISTPRGRFFISNRLPFLSGYRNTDFEKYGGDPALSWIPFWQYIHRWWRWPLPYKSMLVSPICPGLGSKRVADNLVGFLCVDSPRLFVFKEKFDTEILMGVSDGIYAAVNKYVNSV